MPRLHRTHLYLPGNGERGNCIESRVGSIGGGRGPIGWLTESSVSQQYVGLVIGRAMSCNSHHLLRHLIHVYLHVKEINISTEGGKEGGR